MFDVHKYINTAFCKSVPNGEKKKLTRGRRFEGSSEEEQNSFLWSIPRNKLSAALQC
jgi:hypothetical protein